MNNCWREIDAAFAGNVDPLIGKDIGKDFERLFKRIVTIAPPPIGLVDRLREGAKEFDQPPGIPLP